jgi:hypothetical protein
MASNITPNNINGAYPIAGQTNDTQGFRDNFTNTQNNFITAAAEISDLQSKVLLTAPLSTVPGSGTNNMAGATIANVSLTSYGLSLRNNGTVNGVVSLNLANGNVQEITTSGAITLSFAGWATSGTYSNMLVWLNITDATHTVTVSTTSPGVTLGLNNIAGANLTAPGVISFSATGTYLLSFSTVDGGNNILINDLTRNFNNTQSTFQLATFTQTQVSALTPINGMLVYNSTYNKFQGYGNGIWGNIALS